MRTLAVVAVAILGFPSIGLAAPCVPGSLSTYISLGGGGCSIGLATVNDFSIDLLNPLASPIAADDITVTPFEILGSGFRLDFGVDQDAAAGEFFDALVGYSVSAPGILRARLAMAGAAASPDGVVTAVEDLCLGAVFLSDPTTCAGIPAGPLIVFEAGFDQELAAELLFAPTSFFDVSVEIAIDAGPGGSASLDGVASTEFTRVAVAEPSSLLLLGSALLGAARRYRRATGRRRVPSRTDS